MKRLKRLVRKSFVYWFLLGITFLSFLFSQNVYAISIAHDYEASTNTRERYNCVYFTRSLLSELPYGLISFENKKNIINSQTPKVGSVAIVRTNNQYGHIAFVERVAGKSITTLDANWKYQEKTHIVRRTGTKKELGIVGFYDSNRRQVRKQFKEKIIKPKNKTVNSQKKICSIKNLESRTTRTKTGISVYAFLKKKIQDKVIETGLYLWESGMKKPNTPYVKNHYKTDFTKQNTITIYYKPGIEFGKKLKPNTTYCYQIYVVVNGKKLLTPLTKIRTK